MTNDSRGGLTPAEAEFLDTLVPALQRDLEQRFPGRGMNVYVPMVLLAAADLFYRLEEEEALAGILNGEFRALSLPWRLVRTD